MKLSRVIFNRVEELLFAVAVLGLMTACSSSKPSVETAPSDSSSKPAAPTAPHLQVAATDRVIGNVEWLTATKATQAVPGHLSASGWAVSCVAGSPLTVVTLIIDGKPVGETRAFFSRPDVASAFGRPDFEQSGWKMELSLKKLGPGEHPVTVRATNSKGDNTIVPGTTLTIR